MPWEARVIARTWGGVARPDTIEAYLSHLREKTLPSLEDVAGFRGAYVLRRPGADQVPVTVITLWDSLDAIARFSGADVEAAVVPAEAQALLASWDARAVHWEVAQLWRPPSGGPPVDNASAFAHK
jgi:heme-degrading monooxygenase HmoA